MGSPPLGALSGLYVFVVDDNEDARNILESLLTYLGAFVITATSARDALNKLTQVKANVVVCDVHLGDEDALWLMEEGRKVHADVPFIAVSGLDHDEDALRASGFVAFLPKPINHDALVRAVLAAVDR